MVRGAEQETTDKVGSSRLGKPGKKAAGKAGRAKKEAASREGYAPLNLQPASRPSRAAEPVDADVLTQQLRRTSISVKQVRSSLMAKLDQLWHCKQLARVA